MHKITIKKIAELTGFSKTTVSHALSGKRYVAPATVKKIQASIKKHNYIPSSSARSLASNRTGIIGLAYPLGTISANDLGLSEYILALAGGIARHSYKLLMITTPYEKEEDFREILLSRSIDGLVLMGVKMKDERIRFLRQLGFPFVAIGHTEDQKRIASVDIDARAGTEIAMDHLFACGHRRIGFLGIQPWDFGYTARSYNGYKAVFEKHGLSIDKALVGIVSMSTDSLREEVSDFVTKALGSHGGMTALFVLADMVGAMCTQLLNERGIRIPEEVSLISFGNSALCNLTNPPMSAVNLHARELCSLAIERLVPMLASGATDTRQDLVLPELVMRNSVANRQS